MTDQIQVRGKDLSGSRFVGCDMSSTVFDDLDLTDAVFHNICLRGAQISAIDFGGASFSCMNTGEDRPRIPVTFKNMEFEDCTFEKCSFEGVKRVSADVTGMRIEGVLVSEMVEVYNKAKRRAL